MAKNAFVRLYFFCYQQHVENCNMKVGVFGFIVFPFVTSVCLKDVLYT